ncbi:MAG: hypothetical protein CMI63_17915 [Parvularcula sp.]|nr:hypothetical protein [Parvularcula sp.]
MIWASWMDAGVGAGAIRWFRQAKGPGVAIIGAWSHGGGETADPYAQPYGPTEPDHAEKMRMIRDFLDQAMAPEPEEPQRRLIRYVTLGTNAWNETDIWPPADISPSVLFLGDEGRLLPEPADAKTSCDAYEADFNIGSGVETRWTTQLGKPVAYPDQGDGAGWLCYETPALAEDVEITGTPALDLYISSTHEDVMALCHMDDIAPDGRATYLTEGVLRLMHRADLVDDMRLIAGDDIRSFLGDDLRPLEAGAEERFQFPLLPISVVIRKGHKLRFRFAGADKDTFVRIPAVGDPILTFHRGAGKRSRIILPVKGNGKEAFR